MEQDGYRADETADEYMEHMFESFKTLKDRFGDDAEAARIIDREIDLAEDWISDNDNRSRGHHKRSGNIPQKSFLDMGENAPFDFLSRSIANRRTSCLSPSKEPLTAKPFPARSPMKSSMATGGRTPFRGLGCSGTEKAVRLAP